MKLSIKQLFEQYGVIQEMNDWKQHFLAGTKGQKKTDSSILDYVENLLDSAYDDKLKVKNNRLAPWLVSQVSNIGVKNIGTDDRNKFLKVIEWVKEVGGEGNIPKMTLQQAHEFAVAALEKRNKQKQQDEKKVEAPANEIPETEDEKTGFIKRVWVLPDGSKRMWVKVLNNQWLDKQCEAGHSTYGIGCQVGGGWTNHNTYSLIGPPKGNPDGPKSTLVSMAVSKKTKAVNELKQEGNQQPGHQATSGGWNDIAEQVINFIAFSPEAKANINKFYTYSDGVPQQRQGGGYFDGGAGALYFMMDKNPELLNRLVTARPTMKEDNKNIILSHPKFGQKWYDTFGIDLSKYAQENPVEFIENIENYEYLGSELGKILEKINIDKIAVSHPKLVLSKIEKLLGSLSIDMFKKLINTIGIDKYINTSFDKFKDLIKMMSASKDVKYKELMAEMVNKNIGLIMDKSGGGIKGLYDFLDFAAMPKMHRFSRKDSEGQIYAIKKVTVVDPVTGDRTITEEEFPLRDELAILPQKERRKIIENNKEKIKALYTGTDEEKEIKYLRVLFKEINPQDVERTVKAEKDRFIKHYDNNPSKATGYPGILEFYSVIDKNKPGYIFTTHKEGITKVYYKMDLEDLRNRAAQMKLIAYYYKKSQATGATAKKYESAEDLLRTMEISGESPEAIINMAKKEFSPKNVVGKNPTTVDYSLFIAMMSRLIDKSELRRLIETYKDEIIGSGMTGAEAYKDMLVQYSEKGYNVKAGEMVLYNKKIDRETYSYSDDYGIYLTRGRKYKVVDIKDGINIKNEMIEVIDDTKKPSWHHSKDFDLRIVNLQESVRKYVRKKIIETYTSNISENETAKPRYSAVVLDEESRAKLILKFRIPIGWQPLMHHMTMNMGGLSDKSLIGKEYEMKVTHTAGDNKVMAIQVETDAPSINAIKHVTVAVNRESGGKPVMSNKLKNWKPVRTPFVIKGVVEEVI